MNHPTQTNTESSSKGVKASVRKRKATFLFDFICNSRICIIPFTVSYFSLMDIFFSLCILFFHMFFLFVCFALWQCARIHSTRNYNSQIGEFLNQLKFKSNWLRIVGISLFIHLFSFASVFMSLSLFLSWFVFPLAFFLFHFYLWYNSIVWPTSVG